MKRAIAVALVMASLAASACLFPSLDGLSAPHDAAADAGDGGGDALPHEDAGGDAGPCANDGPGIVAHYLFDEGSGTTVHDCSPNGYDALLTGNNAANHWTTGHAGSAILFVPSDGTCVVTTSAQANQTGSALTIAAWITLLDPGGGYIVGQRQQTGWAWRIDVEGTDAGSDLGFAIGLGDGSGNDDSADTFVDVGAWHHVAGVFDAASGTQAIYLDGVATPASPAASAIVPDPLSTTIRVGCRGDDSNYFPGIIDDVRIYSRALDAAEIAALAVQ